MDFVVAVAVHTEKAAFVIIAEPDVAHDETEICGSFLWGAHPRSVAGS